VVTCWIGLDQQWLHARSVER